jgi:hypothetical protein
MREAYSTSLLATSSHRRNSSSYRDSAISRVCGGANMDVKEIVLLAAIAASAGLYLTMVGGFVTAMWRRTSLPKPAVKPRVSILKPLAGADDDLTDNLASFLELPIIVATVACAIAPGKVFGMALFAAVMMQMGCALLSMRILRGQSLGWYWAPLELARAYLLFACWARACLSRRVSWRGHEFELARDSAIVPAEPGILHRVRTLVRA